MSPRAVLPTLLLALGVARPAVAQEVSVDSLAALAVPALLEEGELLHDRLMPLDALHRFEAVLVNDARHYEALWKAAREAVNVGMLAEEGRRKGWYLRGEQHAREALEVREEGIDARHWLAVALGRRALLEGIRTRIRLADEVRRHATAVLARDSLHPGAHHVLGQWHAEVRRLSGFERWVADNILGGERLEEASWASARTHLERAVELAPASLLHRLELARILLDLEEDEAARTQLEQILALPPVEPTDPLHKQEAQELLREMA